MPDKFCKLFDTSEGQFLLTRETDDEGTPKILARYHVKSPIPEAETVVSKEVKFAPNDSGEKACAHAFDGFDQEQAEGMVAEGF